jgi:hypothetical protein
VDARTPFRPRLFPDLALEMGRLAHSEASE